MSIIWSKEYAARHGRPKEIFRVDDGVCDVCGQGAACLGFASTDRPVRSSIDVEYPSDRCPHCAGTVGVVDGGEGMVIGPAFIAGKVLMLRHEPHCPDFDAP